MDSTAFPTDPNSPEPVFNRQTDSAPAIERARKGRFPQTDIVVGFDCEWTDGGNADPPLPPKQNWLLSYQLVVLNRLTGRMTKLVVPLGGPSRRYRLSLTSLLSMALHQAMKEGVIDAIPERLALSAHFSRADLTHLRDWHDGTNHEGEIERVGLKRRIDACRGTYASTRMPLKLTLGTQKVSVLVVDTTLLAPAKTPLATLGQHLGLPKLELRPDEIKNMHVLMRENPERYNAYALRDAEIAALWLDRIWTLMRERFGLAHHTPTLASAGISLIEAELQRQGLSLDDYFGRKRCGRNRFIRDELAEIWPFAANAYHGGRNECFHVGRVEAGWSDLDVASAYVTAMGMLGAADWSSITRTTDLTQLAVVDEAATVALVQYTFPAVRFTSLPERSVNKRGLLYHTEGTSWCTGPELRVALDQGATIHVKAGFRVEWLGTARPFATFAQRIKAVRDEAKATGDRVLDLLAKEIGNSGYGKIAQGVAGSRLQADDGVGAAKGKRVFDTRAGEMITLPLSRISNAVLAGFITGVVRALLSETLSRLPASAQAVSVTTDGFLSDVPLEALDTSGPVATAFKRARVAVAGDDRIWEVKAHAPTRLRSIKTRLTLAEPPDGPPPEGKPLLVCGGFRLPEKPANDWDACRDWDRLHRGRDYETIQVDSHLVSLRDQYEKGWDLVPVPKNRRLNHDYDLKRRMINVREDDAGLLCADTEPWTNAAEFEAARDSLERWKKAQRRTLKTLADYHAWQAWTAERPGQRAAGATAQSGRPPLVNMFLRMAASGGLGIHGTYRDIAAFVTACGWPVNRTTLKNAKRRGHLTYGQLTTLTPSEGRFAQAVAAAYPDCALHLFAAPRSPARATLERCRQTYRAYAQATPPDPATPKRLKRQAKTAAKSASCCDAKHHSDTGKARFNADVRALLRSGARNPWRQAQAWEAILARARAQAA